MSRIAITTAILILAFAITARAQAPYDDENSPAGWAWARVRNGDTADFNRRCVELDPHERSGWDDPCRRIPPQFLVDILTVPKWRDQLSRHRVRLIGALIDGTIDLADAEISASVWIDRSQIEGGLILSDSHLERPLFLRGSRLAGNFSAARMRTDSDIDLGNRAEIEGDVDLVGAKIGGDLDMDSSSFTGRVTADSLSVDGYLLMRGHATFGGEVILRGARIGRNLEMLTSSFTAAVNANSLSVAGAVLMNDHATFGAEVDLGHAKIGSNLEMDGSSFVKAVYADSLSVGGLLMRDHAAFSGELNLVGAEVRGNLEMQTSSFASAVDADSLNVKGSMFMRDHVTFGSDVTLSSVKVGRNLEMEGSSFAGAVNADSLSVEGSLLMNDHAAFGGDVILAGAKVGGNLWMNNSSFSGALNANSLSVAGSMVVNDRATFYGEVNLLGAKVGGNLDMDSSSFAAGMNANRLTVGGYLLMRDHASFGGELNLLSAKVGSNLEMETSSFAGAVTADSIDVKGSLFMRDHATFGLNVNLVGAKIAGNLDLRDATAASVDLSEAVAQEFLFGGLGWWCAERKAPAGAIERKSEAAAKPALVWPLGDPGWQNARCDGGDPPRLILRNAHADAFQDSPDAWPPVMDLEGFRYDRLGGLHGSASNDLRRRSPKEWTDWLARDRTFSTQPYTQLSSVLVAAGHRDTADAIQLAGRERERQEACAHGRVGACAWLTFLSYVAGYGIGLYTFFVLLWVVGLTVLGADVLWYSPNARVQGLPWRLGASLHRLLPIIELSKEFTNFFDNPPSPPHEPRNLNRFQVAYFAGHAIAGWVLGFFLIAAMGGIIQKG